ncbi:hypothetical protein ACOMHN_035563 [Nucella lapillus]
MKRAACQILAEVEEPSIVVEGVVEGVEEVIMPDEKRLKLETEEEVCMDESIVYEEEVQPEGQCQQPPPQYQNLIIQYMDIAQPLDKLKALLESRLQCSLAEHEFFLKENVPLNSEKSLVEQCVQGEGMVQVNLEVKSQPGVTPKINILDILKTPDEPETQTVQEQEFVTSAVLEEPLQAIPATAPAPNKEESENITRWITDQNFRREQDRLKIPLDPVLWTKVHVRHWIQWAVKEFGLVGVNVQSFNSMDGHKLCTLTYPEFVSYIPHDPGDIFWTHLELLRKCRFVGVTPKINILDILKTPDEFETQTVQEQEFVTSAVLEELLQAIPATAPAPNKEESENVTRWIIDQNFRREQDRLKIPLDPVLWTKVHVRHWIQWAVKEFGLVGVNVQSFNSMDGHKLFTLTHPEFVSYIPHDPGDIFWTHLELLRKCRFVGVTPKINILDILKTPDEFETQTVQEQGLAMAGLGIMIKFQTGKWLRYEVQKDPVGRLYTPFFKPDKASTTAPLQLLSQNIASTILYLGLAVILISDLGLAGALYLRTLLVLLDCCGVNGPEDFAALYCDKFVPETCCRRELVENVKQQKVLRCKNRSKYLREG